MRQVSIRMRKKARHLNDFRFFCGSILAACLLLSLSQAGALEKKAPSLSLNQALALSIEFHPRISAKKQEYKAALQELASAQWAVFPSANFSYRGFRENNNQELPDQEVLTVSQPIWTGGKLSGNIGIAKAKRDAAELAIIETEQQILDETGRIFFEVIRARSKLDIASRNVDEHERLIEMIGRRVKADTSPDVDLRLARARLAFSRSLELQNRNALEVSKANLEQLIGQQVFEVKTFKPK